MTENEAQVLNGLNSTLSEPQWHRPMDVSTYLPGDHVAKLLRRMSQHPNGWVEAKPRNGAIVMARGSYKYRITAKGQQALENHRASLRAAAGVQAVQQRRHAAALARLKKGKADG